MNAQTLLVVGELCADIILEVGDTDIRFGQHEQVVPATTITMGSSSAITACGAAALGVQTELASVRGDDLLGTFLADELGRRGVGTQHVRIDSTLPTGASTHLTRGNGDRAILTSMGAIGTTRGEDISDGMLLGATRLHVGSYFLQHALHAGGGAELFRRARSAGVQTSLDGNFDPSEHWDAGIRDVLAHTDIFFGNEEELCGVTGATDFGAAVLLALEHMPEGGVVVAKLGADGAVAASRTVCFRAESPQLSGTLVDTVGAGDTLAAGVLAGLLRGDTLAEALALGVACGTASTRGAGGVVAQPRLEAAMTVRALVAVKEISGPMTLSDSPVTGGSLRNCADRA